MAWWVIDGYGWVRRLWWLVVVVYLVRIVTIIWCDCGVVGGREGVCGDELWVLLVEFDWKGVSVAEGDGLWTDQATSSSLR